MLCISISQNDLQFALKGVFVFTLDYDYIMMLNHVAAE